jgi:hypothetical protein
VRAFIPDDPHARADVGERVPLARAGAKGYYVLPRQSRGRGTCAAGLRMRAKQQGARAMKAGHDRSDRHARYLGDVAVAELVELAQHDRLAQRRREGLDQAVEKPQIGAAFQQGLGIDPGRRDTVAEFLLRFERDDIRRAIVLEPAVAGAPHDLEYPALGIVAAIAVEIAKCPQKRFLHDIGGIGIVARQPSGERVGGIEMGQRYRLEPRLVTPIGVPRHLPLPDIPRFLDTIGRGRSHVETMGNPKATERSFGADLSGCCEIIRQC